MQSAITASLFDRGFGLSIRQPRRLWRAIASDAWRARLDAWEDYFRRGFEVARENGHALAVKLLHGVDTNEPTRGADRVVIVLHEHKWVGGHCANGCTDTTTVDDPRRSA